MKSCRNCLSESLSVYCNECMPKRIIMGTMIRDGHTWLCAFDSACYKKKDCGCLQPFEMTEPKLLLRKRLIK